MKLSRSELAKSQMIVFRVRPDQRNAIERASAAQGVLLTEYVRDLVLEATQAHIDAEARTARRLVR